MAYRKSKSDHANLPHLIFVRVNLRLINLPTVPHLVPYRTLPYLIPPYPTSLCLILPPPPLHHTIPYHATRRHIQEQNPRSQAPLQSNGEISVVPSSFEGERVPMLPNGAQSSLVSTAIVRATSAEVAEGSVGTNNNNLLAPPAEEGGGGEGGDGGRNAGVSRDAEGSMSEERKDSST